MVQSERRSHTLRAVNLDKYGPAENLKIVDVPVSEPKKDEVLIKVEAAGSETPSHHFEEGLVATFARISR